jgi:hypothetical protein
VSEAFVRAADMGEHTMPPMPMPFRAERGDDLLLPKLPEVLRTCGGAPLPFLDGDIEGDDRLLRLVALIGDLPLPAPPLRRGERNLASYEELRPRPEEGEDEGRPPSLDGEPMGVLILFRARVRERNF